MSSPAKASAAPALDGDAPIIADTTAQARARFFNSGNAFNLKMPKVPRARFDAARDAAMAGTAARPSRMASSPEVATAPSLSHGSA